MRLASARPPASIPRSLVWLAGTWLAAAAVVSPARAVEPPDLLGMATRGYRYPEFKAALDALPAGAAAQLRDPAGRTLLHCAAGGSHQQGVLLALAAGVDVNARDHAGRTALFDAAAARPGEDALMIVEMLAVCRAEVNVRDQEGITPLALAATSGGVRAADLLLSLGAEPGPAGVPEAASPLARAREAGNPAMVALLEAAVAEPAGLPVLVAAARPSSPSRRRSRRFADAVRAADLNAVTSLVGDGQNINARDSGGATALFLAVADHRPDLVALLLLEGADANCASVNGRTPLKESTRWLDLGGQRMFSLLLLVGANPNAADRDGRTALSRAVADGNEFAAQWLLWRGAALDVRTPDGSLWEIATRKADWPPMAQLLQRHGLAPDPAAAAPANPVRREPALLEAARRGNLGALEAELARGVPADATDEGDRTALEWAATYGRFDVVDILLRHGANINRQHELSGSHPLHDFAAWGIGAGDSKVGARHIAALLGRGANPNLKQRDGTTPLMAAARRGVTGANTLALLAGGAEVNARDAEGRTALGLARQYGHPAMVKLLVDHGGRD